MMDSNKCPDHHNDYCTCYREFIKQKKRDTATDLEGKIEQYNLADRIDWKGPYTIVVDGKFQYNSMKRRVIIKNKKKNKKKGSKIPKFYQMRDFDHFYKVFLSK